MSIETWKASWRSITNRLQKVDWASFRQCSIITQRIETKNLEMWKNPCLQAKILPKHYEDPLIGKPSIISHLRKMKVTPNSMRLAYYCHRIADHFVPRETIKILEVGGGFGGFAECLCRHYEVEKYYLLDVPVLQTLQGYYMIKAGYGDKFSFETPKETIDLIVSTNSLGEMPPRDVAKYIKLFEEVLRPETGLMFLIQRKERDSSHILTAYEDYPFDDKWDLTLTSHIKSGGQFECYGKRNAKS